MKQICNNCHFLRKDYGGQKDVVSANHRESIKKLDFYWIKEHPLFCEMGVWDEKKGADKKQRSNYLLKENRTNFCFFWLYRQGMSVEGAKALQERETKNKELKNQYFFRNISIFIAAIGLMVSGFSTYYAIEFSKKQFARIEHADAIKQNADLNRLISAVNGILFSFPANAGHTVSASYTKEEQISFFENLNRLLDSQNTNTFLINNSKALLYWRQASSNIKVYKTLIDSERPIAEKHKKKNLEIFVDSIFQDIFTVQEELLKK